MAFASKLFSIIFIAALFSSLFSHIEARASTQSFFFSKNTRGGNQIEETLDEQVEQLSSPPFRPGSQQETFGEEFGESQATAARPFSEENNGFNNNNNFYQNNKAADPNQQGSWFNNDRFYHQQQTTNNGAQKYNQFDANTFPDHRNEFQFPGQQKQQQQPQQQQKQEQELQTQGFEFQDQQQKPQQQTKVGGQGMSDTRKMFNGAYFYDINQDLDKQKNSVNRFYQEAANNGGGGGRFNYNRFQFHKQAEGEFEP